MKRWALVAAFFASWLVVGWGCEDEPTPTITPSGTATGFGGGLQDAGNGDGSLDAASDGSGLQDGGLMPVYLALVANPSQSDATPPTPAEQIEAELTAFAAGVGAVSLDVGWDELDADLLAARVSDYRQRGLAVLVSLLVVDGEQSRLPASLTGQAWNAPATVAALEGSLAQILSATGTDIDTLILGRDVNRYLEAQPAESDALQALLHAGIVELDALGASPPARAIGLGFVAADPQTAYLDLASVGNVVALSYFPGLGEPTFPTQTSATKDLDAMIALANGRPLVLQAVGYPSATSLDSSADTQALQLDALFSALDPRREHVAAVVVHMLHDVVGEGCDALLASRGLDPGPPLSEHVCSLGLRDELGEPKAAWQRFLQAAAHYSPR